MKNKKIELIAPAGNFEKLEIALHYGADAIYLGGKNFSLRNFADNFTITEIKKAIDLAHQYGVYIYVAVNIYPRNNELEEFSKYLQELYEIKPDALIVSDPGIFYEIKEIIPDMPLHLSTQANTTNYKSVLFWQKLGVKRINIARELSLIEIKEITEKCDVEIEAFVHGALCISYSGRCLLSSFMADRESNRGMCCQPCRWKYAVCEEKRPGEYFPVEEDGRGTYIFNSKDLCMINHIPEMIDAGICALKIEGRMKTINYLASTVKIYREAIDDYYKNPSDYKVKPEWSRELCNISNRGYCSGFYLAHNELSQNYLNSNFMTEYIFIGMILEKISENKFKIDVRNKFFLNDHIEILSRNEPVKNDIISDISNEAGENISFAQPGNKVIISLSSQCNKFDMLRKTPQNKDIKIRNS